MNSDQFLMVNIKESIPNSISSRTHMTDIKIVNLKIYIIT